MFSCLFRKPTWMASSDAPHCGVTLATSPKSSTPTESSAEIDSNKAGALNPSVFSPGLFHGEGRAEKSGGKESWKGLSFLSV